jgi:hypothetical protein
MRHALSETLNALFEALQPDQQAEQLVRVTRCSVEAPLEVRLRRAGDEIELLGDLPGWRWQSGFAERPGRMRVICEQTIES